ncbi:MAG: 4-alpha-glucanotransferase [Candidatus Aminicenantes bacterium]|nr:4-alpha-glucanotransferase [Candidatus Aminicenantes bacterium]
MDIPRSSGTLLHITSLPGQYGIGTLGKEAYEFVDLLKVGGLKYWQVLPFHPVSAHFDFSPYSPVSVFAGNPLLINLEMIDKEDWMMDDILSGLPKNSEKDFVDFREIVSFKMPFLRKAFENFIQHAGEDVKNYFNYFCQDQKFWLDDYALFISLSVHYDDFNWLKWDQDISTRKFKALKVWRARLHSEIEFQKFLQFVFLKQWFALKKYANNKGIKIIGDLPFYVNLDGSDAWAHPGIFQLDRKTLQPSHVSGIETDYITKAAQKWGNPLYKWFEGKKLKENTLKWWVNRFKNLLNFVDIIKLNHFIGFESEWSIPAKEKVPEKGKWIKGPGIKFFTHLKDKINHLTLIADDWKYRNPQSEKMRDDLNIPGTKVLQLAFDSDPGNTFLPHNFKHSNCILYTSSEDNNTANGWFYHAEMDDEKRNHIMSHMGTNNWDEFHWHFIKLALGSIARLTLLPVHDILGLGEETRINTPGKPRGNWIWKLIPGQLTPKILLKLKKKCQLYGRV